MTMYDVCIIGGGPAGMLTALLLSERGRKVLVLEQQKDFSREYRGEVLMPRFTQMLEQIGLREWVETIPHVKIDGASFYFRHKSLATLQFKNIAPSAPNALWMPQTQLLNAFHERCCKNPDYEIWFDSKPLSISSAPDKAREIKIKKQENTVSVCAKVIIGADGRFSQVRKLLPFPARYEDYRFDILWFTIPKPKDYKNSVSVYFNGKWNCLVLPKYPDKLQCGLLVAPHELIELKKKGIGTLKVVLPEIHLIFTDFAKNLKDFTDFHVLQARMHFVDKWAKEGIVLIGDSAHCCSPAGAIGVSVAVGTAIIAADVIHENLDKYQEVLPLEILNQIQVRRENDVLDIHRIQKLFGRGLPINSKILRYLIPLILSVFVKSPFFRKVQKRLMVLPAPLRLKSL